MNYSKSPFINIYQSAKFVPIEQKKCWCAHSPLYVSRSLAQAIFALAAGTSQNNFRLLQVYNSVIRSKPCMQDISMGFLSFYGLKNMISNWADFSTGRHLFLEKGRVKIKIKNSNVHVFTQCWFFFHNWIRELVVFTCILILCYWPNTGPSCIHCCVIGCCLAHVLEQHGLKDHSDCTEMCCVRSLCVLNVNNVTAHSISAKPFVWERLKRWRILAPAPRWGLFFCPRLCLSVFARFCLSGLLDDFKLHKKICLDQGVAVFDQSTCMHRRSCGAVEL